MNGPQETCEPAGSHGYDLAWLVSPKQREIKQHDLWLREARPKAGGKVWWSIEDATA